MTTNTVTLIGNLVEDPELRFTPSGIALATVRLAVSRRYRDRNEEWQEETLFIRGTLWRDAAENCAESLTKGTRVIVSGRLELNQWETKEGDKRSEIRVSVDEIGPSLRWATAAVTRSPRAGDSYGGGGQPATPAAPVARDNFGPDEAPF
jgi:single-strand DNA-binding protein